MNQKTIIIISAATAFVIGFGGSMLAAMIAVKGENPSAVTWLFAFIVGLVTAAKDLRSLFKLPPVNDETSNNPKP